MNSVNLIGRVGGKDRTGETHGMLTAIRRGSVGTKGQLKWFYQCECGAVVERYPHSASAIKHCGCKTAENLKRRPKRHGMCGTKDYVTWEGMKARCQNQNHHKFPSYGGRGITLCEKWQTFEGFHEDMGGRPEGHTLERVDNDKGYSKENCVWATRKTQQRNRRVNHIVAGQCLTAAADNSGIKPETVRTRLRLGWSEERAVSTPPKQYKKRTP